MTTAPHSGRGAGGWRVRAAVIGFLTVLAYLIPSASNFVYLTLPGQEKYWLLQLATGILIAALPLILGASGRTALRWLLVFALFSPFAAGYALATKYPPSLLAFQVLREATGEELSTYIPQLLACGICSLVALCLYWFLWRQPELQSFRLPKALRIAGALLLVASLGKDVARDGVRAGGAVLVSRLERLQPVAPIVIFARLKMGYGVIPDRTAVLRRYRVQQTGETDADQLCVLVIGESARTTALGLYNSSMATTPRLNRRDDIVVFRHVASCGTATIQSVPILLTGRFPDNGEILPFRHLDLVEAFRLAGFHTTWMSTQTADGEIASFISAFSKNAEDKLFLNGRMEKSRNVGGEEKFDGAMLAPFERAISGPPGKRFIVVHMIGSHSPYTLRYPPEFTKWPVDPDSRRKMYLWLPPFDTYQRRQLDDAYLNATLYSDWFLDRLISLLKARGGPSMLFYLSDHGENDAEAKLMPAGHAVPTKDVITVPLFVWASPEMSREQPAEMAALRANATKKITSQDLFATVCGFYRLETPEADPTRRLGSTGYREHVRHVLLLDDRVLTLPQ